MEPCTYSRVLFVGTGGGNDVFSTTLAMYALWNKGFRWNECSIAGALSPFHQHLVRRTGIPGVYETLPKSRRFLLCRRPEQMITFIDSYASLMIGQTNTLGCNNVLGLSLKDGTKGLALCFQRLREHFDFIVLVDVGGDCFYRGAEDTHVLSPMFDAMVLKAFVDANVPGFLFEAGPGTDGELDPASLKKSLAETQAEAHPLSEETIATWELLYKEWIEKKRPGRTVPITIEAFRSAEDRFTLEYRTRAHLGEQRWYHRFDQVIDTGLCKNFYLVDPTKIMNPFMVDCFCAKDWFDKTQVALQRTNCEPNLEYLNTYHGLMQFLTPSPIFPEDVRHEIIEQALCEIARTNTCDGAWMFPEDWESFSTQHGNNFQITEESEGLIRLLSK